MQAADSNLLQRFNTDVLSKVPHPSSGRTANPTPLLDVTGTLAECAAAVYGIGLDLNGSRVFAKFDSGVHGGSIKVRPAVSILGDAIGSGKLTSKQTVFEATSGNFGIALSLLGSLGVPVVALVSRKLQGGVTEELKRSGVMLVDLDIEICPAPGAQGDVDALMAKGVAASVRQQLADLGFDGAPFDRVRSEAEGLLARQDAIGLAKLLARAYGGFCPEQYDNEMNPEAHRSGTGPELEEQLRAAGADLGSAEVICAFGTGGTATGLSRYSAEKHGRKMVRVVFPKAGQDVAGIRTREKAVGLAFYRPQEYLGEHEVDFEATKPLSRHFNSKGYDVGESGALALYATMQMINFGKSGTMVVLVADGASKYSKAVQNLERPKRDQVRLEEARADMSAYARVVWTHAMLVPTDAGISVIAKSLGVEKEKIAVAKTKDVQSLVSGRSPSGEFEALLPGDGRSVLLVCMSGSTSLFLARALDGKGVRAESLVGGIGALPEARSVPMPGLLRVGQ